MRRKGQTAMEYLMTYGWAILIIIVVVAALYAMGVFTIKPGIKCSPCFPSGSDITYEDHTADTIVLVVGARKVRDITVTNTDSGASCSSPGGTEYDPGTRVTISGCDLDGDAPIEVTYTVVDTGLTHTVTATLHGA